MCYLLCCVTNLDKIGFDQASCYMMSSCVGSAECLVTVNILRIQLPSIHGEVDECLEPVEIDRRTEKWEKREEEFSMKPGEITTNCEPILN
jgi:hypothetical protein